MERRGEAVQRWVKLGAMWAFLSGFTNRFYRIHRRFLKERETDSYVCPFIYSKLGTKIRILSTLVFVLITGRL